VCRKDLVQGNPNLKKRGWWEWKNSGEVLIKDRQKKFKNQKKQDQGGWGKTGGETAEAPRNGETKLSGQNGGGDPRMLFGEEIDRKVGGGNSPRGKKQGEAPVAGAAKSAEICGKRQKRLNSKRRKGKAKFGEERKNASSSASRK